MHALRVTAFGGPAEANAAFEDLARPVPGPEQLVIEVHAVPVNFVDLITLRGDYQFKPELPYTPGKGPAGVVTAVGDSCNGWRPGDRVLGMAEYGGFAEQTLVNADNVYRLPPTMSFIEAAALSLSMDTAWMALRERARIQPGETVLVLGAAGAVGGAATRLARPMGAGKVLAGVSNAERSLLPAGVEIDGVVDLDLAEPRDSIREQVLDLTGGRGVDVVIDPLGGDYFLGATRSLAWRGRLVVVGFASGSIPTFKANYVMLKNIEVSGLQISDYRKRMPELVRAGYDEIFRFFEDGELTAPSTRVMPLGEWRDAMRALESRTARDRLVLVPDGR